MDLDFANSDSPASPQGLPRGACGTPEHVKKPPGTPPNNAGHDKSKLQSMPGSLQKPTSTMMVSLMVRQLVMVSLHLLIQEIMVEKVLKRVAILVMIYVLMTILLWVTLEIM